MIPKAIRFLTFLLLTLSFHSRGLCAGDQSGDTLIVTIGVKGNELTRDWINAVATRMSKHRLDSLTALRRKPTTEELEWIDLIQAKASHWNSFRDSLESAFVDSHVPERIYVLLGFAGGDDAFTYQFNTVCFDLAALQQVYGAAEWAENSERMDRLFSHEFTHLIHKEWAKKNKWLLPTFKDSVLWECFYEGMGMYRSLSRKWLPAGGQLPLNTAQALEALYPEFVEHLTKVNDKHQLSTRERYAVIANLSRGQIDKKWGAFTVAIWLAMVANGDEANLIPLTQIGSEAVILLAKKYLPPELRKRFNKSFK